MKNNYGVTILLILAIVGCNTELNSSQNGLADNTEISKNNKNRGWKFHGENQNEQRHSPLSLINQGNVEELSLAWWIDLPEARGQEATPLVVDGIMYTTAAWSHVYAITPETGEILWHYDPRIDKSIAVHGCCGPVNRGVAVNNGKVFIGAYDGRLIALNAKNGNELWSTQTVDTTKPYTITGAPRVAKGLIYIGNGGAEFGVRGYVSAYDHYSGELVWRFYTVPGNPNAPQDNPIHDKTIDSWSGEFWKLGGGGTVWDSMAYDKKLDLLYIGVGNASPWNPALRTAGEGDNLFISSIVAIRPSTGEYVWHYQTTPQDAWDYTATQHMILADLEISGTMRSVIMQAPKNGFFYVLDRATGEFISAENYVPTTWASGIDHNGRPIINKEAKYWESGKPSLVTPSFFGGHNWHPMSFSPETGLVYLPAQEMAFPYAADKDFEKKSLAVNLGVDLMAASLPDNPAVIKAIKEATKGHLAAWDPVTQKEVWRVQYPGVWNGGVLSTAGNLVFQGSAAGFLNAYDAKTGKQLWQTPTQTGVVAPPITYSIDGEQYITVSAGWGGIFSLMSGELTRDSDPDPINRSRLLTYKIGGGKVLPKPNQYHHTLPDFSTLALDPLLAKKGHRVFERYCAGCHGTGVVGGGVVPDLRYSSIPLNAETWKAVVNNGALESKGMVGFSKELSLDEIESIRHYIIDRNRYAKTIGDVSRSSR